MSLRERIAERTAEIKHRKSALQGVWPSASEEDLEIADAALSVFKDWLESEEAVAAHAEFAVSKMDPSFKAGDGDRELARELLSHLAQSLGGQDDK